MLAISVLTCMLLCLCSGELETTYFRISKDGVVAVVGWPSNSPPLLASMFDGGCWPMHPTELKKVDEINVVLYNMEQMTFESSALPSINEPLVSSKTHVAFDQSKGIARPDIAISGINEILSGVQLTTKHYMEYIIVSQSADFRDERMREFNSYVPFFTNADIPSFVPYAHPKKFLCLIGSPKPHKLYFVSMLHHKGYLKSFAWSGGSMTGASAKEYRQQNAQRAKDDKDIDVAVLDKIADKLPTIIDIDPSLEKQHSNISPELYSRGRIHIVLESEDHSPDVELCETSFRYTEKTLKSIFLGHPFLIYGNFGTLKLLNTHGFKTFHPLLNETYDLLPIRRMRVQALLLEIGRLSSLSESDFTALTKKLTVISQQNQDWLKSKTFKDILRKQGEYALGLSNVKSQDYSEMFQIVEAAMKQVGVSNCEHVPSSTSCNPVCGYTMTDKLEKKKKKTTTTKVHEKVKDNNVENSHTLVFENVEGDEIPDLPSADITNSSTTVNSTNGLVIMDIHKPGAIVHKINIADADETD